MYCLLAGTLAKWPQCRKALQATSACLDAVRELNHNPAVRQDATFKSYLKRLVARVSSASDA